MALEDDAEKCKHTASPLGNGAVVETKDKRILVLKRSENVGEFPGHFVFPGGHSEVSCFYAIIRSGEKFSNGSLRVLQPSEIQIYGHSGNIMDSKGELNRRIAEEMFDGIVREVIEETGIPAASLSDPLFIGISRRLVNVRPTAFFFMRCSLSSSEVLQFYEGAQHGYESTELISIKKENLPAIAMKMPGCHQGGAALYQLMEQTIRKPIP